MIEVKINIKAGHRKLPLSQSRIPVAIIVELVITSHGDEWAEPNTKRVEDLWRGTDPYLKKRNFWHVSITSKLTSLSDADIGLI